MKDYIIKAIIVAAVFSILAIFVVMVFAAIFSAFTSPYATHEVSIGDPTYCLIIIDAMIVCTGAIFWKIDQINKK